MAEPGLSVPTAAQEAEPVQYTPLRLLNVAPGLGLETIDQEVPFQDSTRVRRAGVASDELE